MINPFADIHWNPGTAERRAFGVRLLVGLPIIAAVLSVVVWWKSGAFPAWPLWLGGIGAGIGLLCWSAPRIARPFFIVWSAFGAAIACVIGNVMLAAIFLLAVIPTGLLLRVFGKDPLTRRLDRTAKTYWHDAERHRDPGSYFRQS